MFIPNRERCVKTAVSLGISTMLLFSTNAMAASTLLRVGSQGEAVSQLQQKLKDLGYFQYSKVTGYYGTITRDSVIRFQKSKGLSADGIAGPITLAALDDTYNKSKDPGKGGEDKTPNETGKDKTPEESTDKPSTAIKRTLKKGCRGSDVLELQKILKAKGYYLSSLDGIFGSGTEKAVKDFQKAAKIQVDGIVGPKTIAKLSDSSVPSRGENSSDRPSSGDQGNDNESKYGVEMLTWTEVDKIFARKSTAKVTDVDTGKTFTIYRYGGNWHADVEPLTKADTAIMKAAYGGTWSWARRAVIVEIGGRRIAGSMNGMPHGGQHIMDNDFDGQFCIHFLESRVHESGKVDPDHQAMIRKAAGVK